MPPGLFVEEFFRKNALTHENASEFLLRHETQNREPMVEKIKKTPQNPSVSGARKGALEVLSQLFRHPEDTTPLPVMLARQGGGLEARDAALCSELVYGVLRRHALLDAALAGFLKKPEALSAQVRMVLRLGVYEILFMDGIPARATVNELVNLTRRRFGQGLGGLVNGVLRAVDRQADALRAEAEKALTALVSGTADAAGMAGASSLPLWLTTMWAEQYGVKEACLMAANTLEHPAPCWRANLTRPWGEMLVRHWLERGYAPVGQGGFSAQGLEKGRTQEAGEQSMLATFEQRGEVTRQGASSQLVAEYLAGWMEEAGLAGASLWDACCGRGGKTTALLEKGVHVELASEPAAFRLEELKASLLRLRLPWPQLRSVPAQAVEDSFPLILLDVPCSGTGTLARNAELRLRLSPARLAEISRVQADILAHAWSRLLPGGALFYVTCALNREENEGRIETFLREGGRDGRLVEERTFFPLFPGQDTLFLAILRKEV